MFKRLLDSLPEVLGMKAFYKALIKDLLKELLVEDVLLRTLTCLNPLEQKAVGSTHFNIAGQLPVIYQVFSLEKK